MKPLVSEVTALHEVGYADESELKEVTDKLSQYFEEKNKELKEKEAKEREEKD